VADKKTTKYDRHGNARIIEDVTDANNARFNGFVFDKEPTPKQAEAAGATGNTPPATTPAK